MARKTEGRKGVIQCESVSVLFMLPFVVGQSGRQPSQSSKVCVCVGGGGGGRRSCVGLFGFECVYWCCSYSHSLVGVAVGLSCHQPCRCLPLPCVPVYHDMHCMLLYTRHFQ